VFTARYALSPHIKQIRFVFKGLIILTQVLDFPQFFQENVGCPCTGHEVETPRFLNLGTIWNRFATQLYCRRWSRRQSFTVMLCGSSRRSTHWRREVRFVAAENGATRLPVMQQARIVMSAKSNASKTAHFIVTDRPVVPTNTTLARDNVITVRFTLQRTGILTCIW
jgi:hypothetical protein